LREDYLSKTVDYSSEMARRNLKEVREKLREVYLFFVLNL
jgi:hypothetical protein